MNPQRETTPSPQQPAPHQGEDAKREQTALENVSQGYGKPAAGAHISGKPGPVTESDGIRPGGKG
ncbi:MAG: hypothetical protein ACOZD0_09110 [Pseudomonadota bacterium]